MTSFASPVRAPEILIYTALLASSSGWPLLQKKRSVQFVGWSSFFKKSKRLLDSFAFPWFAIFALELLVLSKVTLLSCQSSFSISVPDKFESFEPEDTDDTRGDAHT